MLEATLINPNFSIHARWTGNWLLHKWWEHHSWQLSYVSECTRAIDGVDVRNTLDLLSGARSRLWEPTWCDDIRVQAAWYYPINPVSNAPKNMKLDFMSQLDSAIAGLTGCTQHGYYYYQFMISEVEPLNQVG